MNKGPTEENEADLPKVPDIDMTDTTYKHLRKHIRVQGSKDQYLEPSFELAYQPLPARGTAKVSVFTVHEEQTRGHSQGSEAYVDPAKNICTPFYWMVDFARAISTKLVINEWESIGRAVSYFEC